jgi:uncharacterized protein involved in response to NO
MIQGWPVFFHAPHRVMFMAGAAQGLLSISWWLFDLAGRYGLLYATPTWPLPPGWIHAALMVFGFFPFFMFGFLMTAAPRWVGAAPVSEAAYVMAFALMASGWIGFHAALWLPQLLVPALGLVLAGWCVGLPELMRVARAPHAGRAHVVVAVGGLSAGALSLAAFLAFAAGGPGWLAGLALMGGIWFFLLPVFATVCHRMLPFFSSVVIPKYRVVQPFWALYLLLACFFGHGILDQAGLPQWTWLCDAPAALVAIGLTLSWQIERAFAVRLLAMLHVSFAWLGAALALYAAQSLLLLAGYGVQLGLAPLHALTIGFFASLLVGMVTRVTLGHSGRDLSSDVATWAIFWGMQGVAVLRVAAEFVRLDGAANLTLLAALGWLAVFGGWCVKFMPSYLKPRPDGRPG